MVSNGWFQTGGKEVPRVCARRHVSRGAPSTMSLCSTVRYPINQLPKFTARLAWSLTVSIVEGSGCRPHTDDATGTGPASGSLQGRNPREGKRSRCGWLYGDCGRAWDCRWGAAVVSEARAPAWNRRSAVGGVEDGRGERATSWCEACVGNAVPMPVVDDQRAVARQRWSVLMMCRP